MLSLENDKDQTQSSCFPIIIYIPVFILKNLIVPLNVPDAINRYIKDLPSDWDCVFDSDYFDMKFDGEINPDCSVYKTGTSKGAHFILLNLSAATKLYENFLPFHEGSDHMYNYLFKKLNMNVYWAESPNVHKIQRESTWMDESPRKRFKWSV